MGCVGEDWEGGQTPEPPPLEEAKGQRAPPYSHQPGILGLLGWLDGFLWLPRVGLPSCGGQPGGRGREPCMSESPCSQVNDMSTHTQRLVLPRGQSSGVRGGLSPGPVHPARPACLLRLSAPSGECQGAWCWPGCSPCTCPSLTHPRPPTQVCRASQTAGRWVWSGTVCPPPQSPGPRGRALGSSTRQTSGTGVFYGRAGRHSGRGRVLTHVWAGRELGPGLPPPETCPCWFHPPRCCHPGPPPGGLSRARGPGPCTASSCRLTCPRLAFLCSPWANLRPQVRMS